MRVKVASKYRVESALWTSTEHPTYNSRSTLAVRWNKNHTTDSHARNNSWKCSVYQRFDLSADTIRTALWMNLRWWELPTETHLGQVHYQRQKLAISADEDLSREVDTSINGTVFALSDIASQYETQIDPTPCDLCHICHTYVIQNKARSCLTETLNITMDGNGLKMQSSIRPL